MLDSSACSQTTASSEDDSGEEELSILPIDTKVVVTGNNRTKSVLIGLHGVVTKAVGLGGWHWLVLKNGLEVKLQRNALSVTESSSGPAEDQSDTEEDNQICSSSEPAPEELRKSLRQKARQHRSLIATTRYTGRNNSCEAQITSRTIPRVDFSKLETETLWRYWKHFNLTKANPNPSREQLVLAVERHFTSQQLDEHQVITGFVQAAKRLKNADP